MPDARRIRKRLRTSLAVDDTIAGIWNTLAQSGRLDSTYIFVRSDNGYTIGQHRRVGKTVPYDRAARTPLLARGPGFGPGAVDEGPALTIDVTATIAAAAGIAMPDLDGMSLLSPRRGTAFSWSG